MTRHNIEILANAVLYLAILALIGVATYAILPDSLEPFVIPYFAGFISAFILGAIVGNIDD